MFSLPNMFFDFCPTLCCWVFFFFFCLPCVFLSDLIFFYCFSSLLSKVEIHSWSPISTHKSFRWSRSRRRRASSEEKVSKVLPHWITLQSSNSVQTKQNKVSLQRSDSSLSPVQDLALLLNRKQGGGGDSQTLCLLHLLLLFLCPASLATASGAR